MAELGVPTKVRERVKWDLLHPKVVPGFVLLCNRLLDAKEAGVLTQFYLPFQGYRDPLEQINLLKSKTSKAGPWQSAHNYGMAVDIVGWNLRDGWNWQPADSQDWKEVGVIAVNAGLFRPIAWDKPHVEHPLWSSIKRQVV